MPPRRRSPRTPNPTETPGAVTQPGPDSGARGDSPEPLPQQEQFYRAPARFGSIPVEAEPKGWDRGEGFRKHYPLISLPTQIIERVSLGNPEPHEPNRLIWGDNLHVMRQIPSNSVDLIYIDPPFFSGREYNVIWGDNNELRSFNDIWEGGMDGYLIWLNARLYEMKRMLKPTGSIYVHCDDHASHYIKIEMDKIFGHFCFRNDIIWRRATSHNDPSRFGRILDHILYYSLSDRPYYDADAIAVPKTEEQLAVAYPSRDDRGRYRSDNMTGPRHTSERGSPSTMPWRGYDVFARNRVWSVPKTGKYAEYIERNFIPGYRAIDGIHERLDALDAAGLIHHPEHGVWPGLKRYASADNGNPPQNLILDPTGFTNFSKNQHEWIGYPTQKPEALLEKIVMVSSKEGDTVADFFIGGGTTATVAQRLGRRFIAVDQSRVAVAVTAERLKQQAMTRGLEDAPIPDFTVEQWGIYEADRLSRMPVEQFREFVLRAYGATRMGDAEDGPDIHGWRNQFPIWVGGPQLDSQAAAKDVGDFANAIRRTPQYRQANLRDGVMLAWGFGRDAVEAAGQLRQREEVDVNFVRLAQVRIGDDGFREHIIGRSTDKADYSEFLTFVQPPVVDVGFRTLGGGSVTFDAGDTAVMNPGAELINVQWDFDYDGERFAATPGYSLKRDRNKRPELRVTHKFNRTGKFRVACRVQDSRGGEAMWDGEVEVK